MAQYNDGDVVFASHRGRDIIAKIHGDQDGVYSATVLGGAYDGDRISLVDAMITGHKIEVQDASPDRVELTIHDLKTAETDTPVTDFETKDSFPPATKIGGEDEPLATDEDDV